MVFVYTLIGSKAELDSSRARKVLCAANFARLAVTLEEGETSSPTSRNLELVTPNGPIGQSNAMLRYIADLDATKNLAGESEIKNGLTDQWLEFTWSEIEVPLAALSSVGGGAEEEPSLKTKVISDVKKNLKILDGHLLDKTFLVGDGVTIADISLCCALGGKRELMTNSDTPNLMRWFNTMENQPEMKSDGGGGEDGGEDGGVGDGGKSGESITYGGVAPGVTSRLFRRSRLRVKELFEQSESLIGKTITVMGWARTVRNADKGKIIFVELSDGSCNGALQCVLGKDTTTGFEAAGNSGGVGSSWEITGEVVVSVGGGQAVELAAKRVEVLGEVMNKETYPMSKKKHTLEHLRVHAHLRPRSKVHAAAMRIRHAMAFATHKFFNDSGFLYIHTPIVTCADCEGAGEQFGITTMLGTDPHAVGKQVPIIEPEVEKKPAAASGGDGDGQAPPEKESVKARKRREKAEKKAAAKAAAGKDGDSKEAALQAAEEKRVVGAVDYSKDFFGKRANLTVSGQLNVETHCCALSDVYTFGPTFRAENSHTTRHLAEFWMIEPEIAFADLNDDINLAEDYIKYCVQYALEVCAEDIAFFEESPFGEKGLKKRLLNVLESPFKRLTYTEGIELLKGVVADGHVFENSDIQWGMDLGSEHERYLCEKLFKKPVVLTDYPKGIKAFYMKLNEDGETVAAADILVPKIGELVGGSQREHRFDVLTQRCEAQGIEPSALWWYLELRKFGTVPHAGFGLGFERLVLFITGLENIRDVIPFPRTPGLADF